jgi:hypothetical protein
MCVVVGLVLIIALGVFVLVSLLYATRCDDNYDMVDGLSQHPGYRFLIPRWSGRRLPMTTRSPMDTIYFTEMESSRALEAASRRHAPHVEPVTEDHGPGPHTG